LGGERASETVITLRRWPNLWTIVIDVRKVGKFEFFAAAVLFDRLDGIRNR
jgi:hypothetical protein